MPSATAVVVHAHPDDEAIFTGATMHALAARDVRVVLVTATAGEAGEPLVPLRRGETLGSVRRRELETACDVLGVARLVMLGHEDSGAHRGPYPARSLGAAPSAVVAAQVASVIEQEQADAVIHYDPIGIYGHIDHVQVHRAGALAAGRFGVTAYEATVDGPALRSYRQRSGQRHVLHAAAGDDTDVGVAPTLAVKASAADLTAKLAAMSAHPSQIGPEFLAPSTFATTYGREWFVRQGPPGLLETPGQRASALAQVSASAPSEGPTSTGRR